MSKTRIIVFAAVAALLIATPLFGACAAPAAPATTPTPKPTPAPAEPIKLVYHEPWGKATHGEADLWWMDEVERLTEGRVTFDRVHGGALGTGAEQPLSIKARVFDLGMMSCIYNPGVSAAFTVTVLPFLTDDYMALTRAATDIMEHPAMQAESMSLNSMVLYHTFSEPMELMSYVPARTVDELKPLKIRGHGGAADAMTAAGLTSVAVPWGELPAAAERRVVDAGCMPCPACARDFGFHDIFDYWIRINFYRFHYGTAINLDCWNELPAEVQQVMLDLAKDAPEKAVEFWLAAGDEAWVEMEAAGVEQVTWSQDELDKLVQLGGPPVWEKWVADREAEGIPGQELLDQMLALIEKYGG